MEIDREKIKELRKIRNKEKRTKKQEESKQIKLNSRPVITKFGESIAIISRDFANLLNPPILHDTSVPNYSLDKNLEFPELSNSKKQLNYNKVDKEIDNNVAGGTTNLKIKTNRAFSRNICDLIVTNNSKDVNKISKKEIVNTYSGNSLDSANPKRFIGKQKESVKKRISAIKQNVLRDELLRTEEDCTEYINYIDLDLSTDFTLVIHEFLKELVVLHEKMFAKNPDKGKIKKRYIVGFHEIAKYVLAKRVKLLIIAVDIKIVRNEDILFKTITDLVTSAKTNEIPYIFSLKRRQLGNVTKKFRPVSCMGILNVDGINDKFNDILSSLTAIKEDQST